MKIITFLLCSWIFLMGTIFGTFLQKHVPDSPAKIERTPVVESLEYRPQKQNPEPLTFTF